MTRRLLVADLFCGAGGSSTGAMRALRSLGMEMELSAVNHWPMAIATHKRNHPTAQHYIEDITQADPEKIVPGRYLDLLMASPECTFHSNARGGKPIHDQNRIDPWAILNWITRLDVRTVLIENVPEFKHWGPLTSAGKPDKTLRGQYFEAWVQAFWSLGYVVDWRHLNAADFGDATTRTRFFLQARKDGNPIVWPEPTHAQSPEGMFGGRKRWRAAREIIDWTKPGRSVLDDPKYQRQPLSENTRRRMAAGLAKFGGALAPLYIALLGVDPIEDADGETRSFVLGKQTNPVYRAVDEPLPTLTTESAPGLVEPILLPYYKTGVADSCDEPLATITTRDRFGLASPMVVPYGPRADARSVDSPAHTVTTRDRLAVADPGAFVLSRHSNELTRPVAEPVPTATTRGAGYLTEPTAFLVSFFTERAGVTPRALDIDKPAPTITGAGGGAIAEPVIVQIDQSGFGGFGSRSVDQPIPTLVTKASVALAEPVIAEIRSGRIDPRRLVVIDDKLCMLDIRFRMLDNDELARAMGFHSDERRYEFSGNKTEVTKQIGNAVAVGTAAALVKAIFAHEAVRGAGGVAAG